MMSDYSTARQHMQSALASNWHVKDGPHNTQVLRLHHLLIFIGCLLQHTCSKGGNHDVELLRWVNRGVMAR